MNTEATNNRRVEHKLMLDARAHLAVSGVTDVVNFDEQTVILNTLCGGMEISGSSLHIRVLNLESGIVELDGKIEGISYFEQENGEKDAKNGFFGKLFR